MIDEEKVCRSFIKGQFIVSDAAPDSIYEEETRVRGAGCRKTVHKQIQNSIEKKKDATNKIPNCNVQITKPLKRLTKYQLNMN